MIYNTEDMFNVSKYSKNNLELTSLILSVKNGLKSIDFDTTKCLMNIYFVEDFIDMIYMLYISKDMYKNYKGFTESGKSVHLKGIEELKNRIIERFKSESCSKQDFNKLIKVGLKYEKTKSVSDKEIFEILIEEYIETGKLRVNRKTIEVLNSIILRYMRICDVLLGTLNETIKEVIEGCNELQSIEPNLLKLLDEQYKITGLPRDKYSCQFRKRDNDTHGKVSGIYTVHKIENFFFSNYEATEGLLADLQHNIIIFSELFLKFLVHSCESEINKNYNFESFTKKIKNKFGHSFELLLTELDNYLSIPGLNVETRIVVQDILFKRETFKLLDLHKGLEEIRYGSDFVEAINYIDLLDLYEVVRTNCISLINLKGFKLTFSEFNSCVHKYKNNLL